MTMTATLEQIAAQLQGYDPHALPADMVGAFLDRLVQPITDAETVPLAAARERVLAADVISPMDVPAHDNAAMDGYALRGAELATTASTRLRVVGVCYAGQAGWDAPIPAQACVRIMTGAVMPADLDTVVPVEMVRAGRDEHGDWIEVPAGAVRPGEHRRLRGEDLAQGQPALRRGQRLGPAALGLVASLGLPQVNVVRRVRVAYFSTGDEVLSLGQPWRPGAIYDSNRYTITAMLHRLGVEVIDLGVVPDDPAALEAAFRDAAAQADAVITSGGVSMGEADHTKAIMRRLGDVVFWRIAMRPGRPMAAGRLLPSNPQRPPTLLLGLPGNPVAAMVTFIVFVRPALLRLMGTQGAPCVPLRARSAEPMRKRPGRTEYQRGVVTRGPDGTLSVRTTGQQGSGVLSSMVQANGLIVLHHEQGNVAVGDEVDVLMFDGVL